MIEVALTDHVVMYNGYYEFRYESFERVDLTETMRYLILHFMIGPEKRVYYTYDVSKRYESPSGP